MNFLGIFSRKEKRENGKSFDEAIFIAEEKEMKNHLPIVSAKKVLEIAPRLPSFSKFLSEKGAYVIRMGGSKEREFPGEGNFVVSHWESLPFLNGSLDFIFLRTFFLKSGFGRLLHEASRTLGEGGQLWISDLHPFSLMAQEDHRKSAGGEEGLAPGFERYFKWFQETGFTLKQVRESFFDGSFRKFFASESQKKEFETLRKSPFLIFFQLVKEK